MPLFVNSVALAGNLTRDPQLRFFASERAVANFGLAINRRYRGQDGEMKEETTFVDVECWGRQAELVGQYLTKGQNCYLEGELKLDQWEAQDGGKRSKLKVNARRVQFLGAPGGQRSSGGEQSDDGGGAYASAPSSESAPSAAPAVPPPADLGDDEPPF